jgi:hypothetical protein
MIVLCDEKGNETETKIEKGDEDLEGICSQRFKWLSMMEDFNRWMLRKDPNMKYIEKMTFNAWKSWQNRLTSMETINSSSCNLFYKT